MDVKYISEFSGNTLVITKGKNVSWEEAIKGVLANIVDDVPCGTAVVRSQDKVNPTENAPAGKSN